MRRSLNEISRSLDDKLREDTNTLITTTSSDPAVCRLASELNEHLRALRREQLQLKTGNRELQSAITNIAHDLRTPLTSISGYLELLERDPSSEKAPEYLAILRERTDSLNDLTEELFRYSVIANTANELQPEPVSLNDVLEVSLAAAYQPLVSRGISPEVRLPEQSVLRTLDKKALQRIFGNILNNAAKYSAGDLSVSLTPDGTVTFSNSAPALSEVEVGRLFERFYTVENARASTGLGLSIAKLLTEKMGGTIRAEYTGGIFSVFVCFPPAGF